MIAMAIQIVGIVKIKFLDGVGVIMDIIGIVLNLVNGVGDFLFLIKGDNNEANLSIYTRISKNYKL